MNQLINNVSPILLLIFPIFISSYTFALVVPECPDIHPIDYFNLTAIEGVWHEIARYPNAISGDQCISYDLKHNGTNLIVTTVDVPEGSPHYLVAVSQTASDHKGIMTHEVTNGHNQTILLREYVLVADYNNYFITAECYYDEDDKAFKEYVWVITRSKDPSVEVMSAINKFLKSSTFIDSTKLVWYDLINQTNCRSD